MLLRLFLCLLALVNIAPADRVPNRTGCQCVWSSLETIARYHKIQRLYNITRQRTWPSGPKEVELLLSRLHIRAYQHPMGTQDYQSLKNAVLWGWPVGIGLNGSHCVTLVDATDSSVAIIDNSDPSLSIRRIDLPRFRRIWDGWLFCLVPEGQCP